MFSIDREALLRQFRKLEYLPNKNLPAEVTKRLPEGHRVMAFHKTLDMYECEYEAILVRWTDKSGLRLANFRVKDGSYVDDLIM